MFEAQRVGRLLTASKKGRGELPGRGYHQPVLQGQPSGLYVVQARRQRSLGLDRSRSRREFDTETARGMTSRLLCLPLVDISTPSTEPSASFPATTHRLCGQPGIPNQSCSTTPGQRIGGGLGGGRRGVTSGRVLSHRSNTRCVHQRRFVGFAGFPRAINVATTSTVSRPDRWSRRSSPGRDNRLIVRCTST